MIKIVYILASYLSYNDPHKNIFIPYSLLLIMDFDKVLEKRENVKKFTSKKPPAEQIVEAIQASNATPTPGNVHNFIYILVKIT